MSKGTSLTFSLIGKDVSASKAIKGVGRQAEATHKSLGKFGGAGKVAGLAVAGGIGLAVAAAGTATVALAGMAKAAMEDEAGQKRLARELRNTAGATTEQVASVEDWISAQGVAKGVADDALRPALQRLARSTGDVADAQGLATLAMDISAGTGKSLESVSAALAKAHDGNAGALGRLGITTKDAAGKTLDFDQIAKNAAQTFKGQASEGANTLEGKMGRLSLMFSEAKESLGAKLLPVLERVGSWLFDKGIPAFQRFADDVLKPMAQRLIPVLKEYWGKLQAAFEQSKPGLERIVGVLKIMGKLFVEKIIPVYAKMAGFVVPLLIKAIGKLGEILPPIISGFLRFGAQLVGFWRAQLRAVGGFVSGVLGALGHLPGKMGEPFRKAKDKFDKFRDGADAALAKVQDDLRDSADEVDRFNRRAKLKANISDLKAKIAAAKVELKSPDLTKERRAKLTADISRMEKGVRDAQRKLDGVKDKTVKIKLKTVVERGRVYVKLGDGRKKPLDVLLPTTGGLGGTGHGLMSLTHGKGAPGARWNARGPMWSWHRGPDGQGHHNGVDIVAPGGTPVYTTRGGSIVHRGFGGSEGSWAGNHVVERLSNGVKLVFAHLSKSVASGSVSAGGRIGSVGSTGNSSGNHLHVSAIKGGTYVNPVPYLATGGILKARPGGVPFVGAEAGYDEAVIPLPPNWRNGGAIAQPQPPIVVQLQADGRTIQEIVVRHEQRTGRYVLSNQRSA